MKLHLLVYRVTIWHFESKERRTKLCVLPFSNYQLNAQFLHSSTVCMLHYDPQHVSSSTQLILRRTNCITTVSGIVTLCKQPYSMQVESGLVRSQPAYCTAVHVEGRSVTYIRVLLKNKGIVL